MAPCQACQGSFWIFWLFCDIIPSFLENWQLGRNFDQESPDSWRQGGRWKAALHAPGRMELDRATETTTHPSPWLVRDRGWKEATLPAATSERHARQKFLRKFRRVNRMSPQVSRFEGIDRWLLKQNPAYGFFRNNKRSTAGWFSCFKKKNWVELSQCLTLRQLFWLLFRV